MLDIKIQKTIKLENYLNQQLLHCGNVGLKFSFYDCVARIANRINPFAENFNDLKISVHGNSQKANDIIEANIFDNYIQKDIAYKFENDNLDTILIVLYLRDYSSLDVSNILTYSDLDNQNVFFDVTIRPLDYYVLFESPSNTPDKFYLRKLPFANELILGLNAFK